MTKVSLLLAVGFLVSSCGGDPPPPPQTTTRAIPPPPLATPTVEKPPEPPKLSPAELQQRTLRGLAESMDGADARKLAALYTESAVMKVAGAPAEASGRDAIEQAYKNLFAAFSNFRFKPSRVFTKGEIAVVEWSFNGTHSGDLYGIKPTDKPVGAQGVDVLWFTPEGEVKEHHVYYDGATILSQIGVSKQKARPIPPLPANPEPITSTDSADEKKNVELSKAMNTAIETRKEADFLGGLADNVEYDDMTQPQTAKGKADAKKFFKEVTTGFPDVKLQTTNAWAIGDYVISEGTMTGTHKGSFFGMSPTKKTLTLKTVDIRQYKEGKLVKGWSYANGAEFAQQLGIGPKPGAAGEKGEKKPAEPKTPTGGEKKTDTKPAEPKATPAAPAKK